MLLPIEDLSNQVTKLLSKLDPAAPLYSLLNATIDDYWLHLNAPNVIERLCNVHTLLNQEEHIRQINAIGQRGLLEEINKTLLVLFHNSFLRRQNLPFRPPPVRNRNKTSYLQWGLFLGIALAATIFAAVDGASIIQSFISSFATLSNISNLVLIPVQISFALIAVTTFYCLELNTVGKSLGIRAFDLGGIFKSYAEESHLYKTLFSLVQTSMVRPDISPAEFVQIKQNYEQVSRLYGNFENKVNEARIAQAAPSMIKNVVKKLCTGTAALVVGTIGALGGQTFAATVLPIFLGAAATGPIGLGITLAAMGFCFGVAALLYVFVQEKAVHEFVNKAWGTPSKSINRLIKKDQKIQGMRSTINQTIISKERQFVLQNECAQLQAKNISLTTSSPLSSFNSADRREDATASQINRFRIKFAESQLEIISRESHVSHRRQAVY